MNWFRQTVLLLTVLPCALAPAGAQLPPSVERGLPGNAFSGVVPAANGRLYGVTYEEGGVNMGTLYSVDAALSSPPLVHVVFTGPNGAIPYDELTYDSESGRFYGATSEGGAGNLGTIFAFDPTTNVLTTLKDDFDTSLSEPRGPFVVSGGFIFGVIGRPFGGVFRMATDGSGYTIIHNFEEFGSGPYGVTGGADKRLYGVTTRGGLPCNPSFPTQTCGTVFRLRAVLPGDTDVQFETLYQISDRFDAGPQRTVVYGSDGLIYFNNHFRIYRLNPDNPAATFQMIWQETGGSISMSIIEGSDQRIYAASYSNNVSPGGRVFSINRDGSGARNLRNFSFNTGSTAYGPYGRLFRSSLGLVYGTTEYTNLAAPFNGTVFAINPDPIPFQIFNAGRATYNGSETSITIGFLSVPNQNLSLEYSTNLVAWALFAGNPANSGTLGLFFVTFTAAGDQTLLWNRAMYFRATPAGP
jgi:uncharacterized repeat protein (TIGR03803 family)